MKKKRVAKIKKWQLLRFQSKEEAVDLSSLEALTVGRRAFSRKKNLHTVTLPNELSAIKTEAFLRCKALTKVTLGRQNAVGISEKAFVGCTALQEIENSEMIFSIGARAFANCTSLEGFTFGSEIRRIGDQAFYGCEALRELTLPSCIRRIGKSAFANSTSLSQVTLQKGSTALAPNLFRNCRALCDICLPETLSAVSVGAFRNCTALQEIVIPSGVRKIEKKAFFNCTNLKRAELSLGCERIGKRAFARCTDLAEVGVPRTLKRLGFAAFGLGKKQDKIVISVENEYMLRRIKRLLFFCGSLGRAEVVLAGKTVAQRKRERRRTTLEKEPVHLIDPNVDFSKKPRVYAIDPSQENTASNQNCVANFVEQTCELVPNVPSEAAQECVQEPSSEVAREPVQEAVQDATSKPVQKVNEESLPNADAETDTCPKPCPDEAEGKSPTSEIPLDSEQL